VIRLSSLGDVVLTTPVFSDLKAAGAKTVALTRRGFAPLYKNHPAVDDVWIYEERGFWGWMVEIRRQNFDIVLDLHGTPRSWFWTLFSKASRRERFDKRTLARRWLVWTKKVLSGLNGSVVDRYLEPLQRLGIPIGDRTPRLSLSPNERLSDSLEKRLGGGPFVAVAPGAQHATKRWPASSFAKAADLLSARLGSPGKPLPIVVLGASQDLPVVQEMLTHSSQPVQNLAGQTTVRDMMLILRRCALLLTNDSGPMHVGVALGVPTVAFFGPTVKAFGFFPSGPSVCVLEKQELPCRPCSLHGSDRCPLGHFNCLRGLSPEDAVQASLSLLEGLSVKRICPI